ncbi:hypothetical protein RB601_004074 [Gaeumannomyces tritici]
MSRRHQTLPPAQTSSAREALQSFYCQLCSKGYTRMNDYEAHLSSYDHTHKQRLKDMKAMVRDPGAAARARRAEAKADAVVSVKIGTGSGSGSGSGSGGGGFKKGGFKKSGFKAAFVPVVAAVDKAAAAAAVATPECGSPVSNKDSVVAWSKGFATPAASDYTDCTSVADQDEDVDQQDAESDSDDDDDDDGYNTYNPRFPTA